MLDDVRRELLDSGRYRRAVRARGGSRYVGSRGLCGKRTKRIFHPRLLKRTDVFSKGEGDRRAGAQREGRKLDLPLRQAGMM
jgi:hypothetical protein